LFSMTTGLPSACELLAVQARERVHAGAGGSGTMIVTGLEDSSAPEDGACAGATVNARRASKQRRDNLNMSFLCLVPRIRGGLPCLACRCADRRYSGPRCVQHATGRCMRPRPRRTLLPSFLLSLSLGSRNDKLSESTSVEAGLVDPDVGRFETGAQRTISALMLARNWPANCRSAPSPGARASRVPPGS
jgi:hypothetical protein